MKIRVEYVAQIKDVAGRPGEVLEVPADTSVLDLLRSVARTRGERLRGLLLDAAGGLRPSALVFVGDEQFEAGQPQPLRDGDTVTIMSPLAGG
jgi:molybdopterin converting factor small subunit